MQCNILLQSEYPLLIQQTHKNAWPQSIVCVYFPMQHMQSFIILHMISVFFVVSSVIIHLCKVVNYYSFMFWTESTFSFLVEKWKDNIPHGYMLKRTSVDQPFEEDICCCHFNFVNLSSDSELVLKFQWLIGERILSSFLPIADAVGEVQWYLPMSFVDVSLEFQYVNRLSPANNKVYWPKHDDVGKFLKVECTPILNDVEYPCVFAVSSVVAPGTSLVKCHIS